MTRRRSTCGTRMEQVVSQLQHELFSLRAQVAAQVQISQAARAINNLATAQVRNDTPSLIDVKGLGRPKELSGKEEDFQQWSKKREAFFAGVIKESEMMLEWAAEQATETNSSIVSFCRLRRTRSEEYSTWSLCCSRRIQRLWLSRVTRRMTLLPTRGRTHWRHGGGCRNDMILQQEEENETFFARSFLRNDTLFWNFKRESNAGSPVCCATRRS